MVQKFTGNNTSDEAFSNAASKSKEMKTQGKLNTAAQAGTITKIIFACDAGMGSSALGAAVLRKKVDEFKIPVTVTNQAIRELTADEHTLVITQEELSERARKQAPNAHFHTVKQFLPAEQYDEILKKI